VPIINVKAYCKKTQNEHYVHVTVLFLNAALR